MYVCGITPYDATHIGHANTYVAFDLLHRVWLDAGLDVHYVQNVTDIDDPLLERARATGVDWSDLAEQQIQLYREDMAALNVLPPRHFVGAVEAIPQIVELIEELDSAGRCTRWTTPSTPTCTSPRPATTSSVPCPGSPRPRRWPCSPSGAVTPNERARRPRWTVWSGGRPARVSRPGNRLWAPAVRAGTSSAVRSRWTCWVPDFDVQGGGSDLIFPHHEMSAGEARVATGQPFARAYLHSGMVGLDGAKMSKSRGNLVFVSTLRESGVDPMAIRLALLAHHYRDDWDWTDDALAAAEDRLSRWREAVRLDTALNADEVLVQMRAALALDLDAPTALAAVDAWAGASTAIDSDDTEAPAPGRPGLRSTTRHHALSPRCPAISRRHRDRTSDELTTRACTGVGVIPNRR